MEKGLEILKSIINPGDELLYLINLGEFILCTVITGIHAKKWHHYKTILSCERNKDVLAKTLCSMEEILKLERINVENAIPLVQMDSRLGWEPSMEYMTDEEHLRWKLRQVDYVLYVEIEAFKKSLQIS